MRDPDLFAFCVGVGVGVGVVPPGKLKEDCELEKSLVSLLAALFQAGYYHRAENGELIVDIAQVCPLPHEI